MGGCRVQSLEVWSVGARVGVLLGNYDYFPIITITTSITTSTTSMTAITTITIFHKLPNLNGVFSLPGVLLFASRSILLRCVRA